MDDSLEAVLAAWAPQVYADPQEPGAPQPGDLVVVAVDGALGSRWADTDELVGELAVVREGPTLVDGHPWNLRFTNGHLDAVHAVRRPTEAELAQWALEQHHG